MNSEVNETISAVLDSYFMSYKFAYFSLNVFWYNVNETLQDKVFGHVPNAARTTNISETCCDTWLLSVVLCHSLAAIFALTGTHNGVACGITSCENTNQMNAQKQIANTLCQIYMTLSEIKVVYLSLYLF